MTIASQIEPNDALQITRDNLGLPLTDNSTVDRTLIAQALRRVIFHAAPCRHQVARRLVLNALSAFTDNTDQLSDSIETTLEHLIAMGDVLEIQNGDGTTGQTILRPTPPSFVKRSADTLIVLGVAGDQITPNLEHPLIYTSGGLRMLCGVDANDLCETLKEEGLIELQHEYWLHTPSEISAALFVEKWRARLPMDKFRQSVDDLVVLNTSFNVSYYKGRWVPQSKIRSGIFVARRPQRFGADLWLLAEFKGGNLMRFVDIHTDAAGIRSCDEAWRIQAAIDALSGTPQVLSVYSKDEDCILAFDSPIPSWIERRLLMFGEHLNVPHSLLAFRINANQAEEEIEWLKSIFWMEAAERVTS